MKPFFLATLLSFLSTVLFAQIKLPKLVRDSMVLQRDTKLNIWGWATPGEKISVQFNNKTVKTTTGKDGKWAVQLPSMKAGGPYIMNITGNNQVVLRDVLVGDVWLCAGQSNMVHQMGIHDVLYEADIAKADYPQIRHFWVPNVTNMQAPQDDLPNGFWKAATPTNVRDFSAVAYFFAKKIYEKYHVPIGLINASWGGTPIEAWMSEESLKEFPSILSTVQKNKDTVYVNSINRAAFNAPRPPQPQDKGIKENWFNPSYSPKGWRTINIPGYWEDQGIKDLDGVVWYRREIDVPANMANADAKVFLGRIVDADVLYINGKQVGATTYMYPQRRYKLPAGTLKPGKNLFVVRVTNNFGKGGFVPDKPYQLIAGKDTIDLKGYWQYKVGQVNIPQRGFGGGGGIATQNQPTALYNSMLAPLMNYGVKGFLWYQGESNTGRAAEYAKLQPAMIADWRQKWKSLDAPFLFVQLPGFMEMNYLPVESQWAQFREAQAKSLSVPNTAMAVAIDLGEWNDIHPDRKKEVGERLALAAERLAYGDRNVVYSGPVLQSAMSDGNKIKLSFSSTGSGLTTIDGEEPGEFAIAGADKKFVWAKAKIEGNHIIVWNNEMTNPMYVRYAWADNPVNPNLYNKEGLPASPFEAAVSPSTAGTQNNGNWNGKKAAVVLTYDDGLNVHLSNSVPALDSVGLKGTFYISDYFGGLQAQIPKWKIAAANGHELANHTVYHPCEGGRPGREFVKPETDLNNYTVKRITDEIKTMNALLKSLDGKQQRTFAFPCSDTKIHDTAYIDYAKNDFIAARAVRSEMPGIDKVDLFDLPCYMINGQKGEELIALVKKAMEENKLLVFLFHGVGGEHSLNVSLTAHHQLLKFLKQNEKEIWIAPMVEVAKYVKDYQSKKKI